MMDYISTPPIVPQPEFRREEHIVLEYRDLHDVLGLPRDFRILRVVSDDKRVGRMRVVVERESKYFQPDGNCPCEVSWWQLNRDKQDAENA